MGERSPFERIEKHIQSAALEDGVHLLCKKLLRALAETRASLGTQHLTFHGLARLVGTHPDNPELLSMIQFLASPAARALETHFFYLNPEHDDPNAAGIELSDDEVREAHQQGFLVDPETGERVRDFQRRLFPYFRLSL